MNRIPLVKFELKGKFAHFLRAEANVSAPTYSVPPRTVLLGILGAILGLEKDEPQVKLEHAWIALSGPVPRSHWHRVKLRKDPPEALPWVARKTQQVERQTKPEKPALINQEWLFEPRFLVWVNVPKPYLQDLEWRLRERRWHFSPSMGLAEHSADLSFLETVEAEIQPLGVYPVRTVFPRSAGTLQMDQIFREELAIHAQRMPCTVTADRIFLHKSYFIEKNARAIPLETELAYKSGNDFIIFL